MIEKALIIKMYESTLINDVPFNRYYLKMCEDKHAMAITVFKYAVEDLLKWTPEMTRDNMNAELIKYMKLDSIYRFLEFPSELVKSRDYFYIAHILYPDRIKYDKTSYIFRRTKELLETKDVTALDILFMHNDRYFELYTKKMFEIEKPYMSAIDIYNCFYKKEYTFLYKTDLLIKYISLIYPDPVIIPANIYNINYINEYFDFKKLYDKVDKE
jgi:hypothetical protein